MTKTEQLAVRKAIQNYEQAVSRESDCRGLGVVCPQSTDCLRCRLIYQARAIMADLGVATRAELAAALVPEKNS